MSQEQKEQQSASEKAPTTSSNSEDCQQISDKCDIVLNKIKTKTKTKKRVKSV